MNKFLKIIFFIYLLLSVPIAFASGPNYNDTTNQPLTSGVNPNFSVNVGIGSENPVQKLDVNGTVRMQGFVLTASASSGYVLTSDTNGNGTWAAASGGAGSNYWNYSSAGNIGISTTQAVGIGTTFVGGTGEAALAVMNGNVGIGTWVPGTALSINGTISMPFISTTSTAGNMAAIDANGNLIESSALWVSGGQTYTYGLTAGNGRVNLSGGLTYGTDGALYASSGKNLELYSDATAGRGIFIQTGSGNVGIGTITPSGELVVMNGNVGVGTATPQGGFVVTNGNVGIGTWAPNGSLTIGAGQILANDQTSGNVSYGFKNAATTGFNRYNGGVETLSFMISGTERMTLVPGGLTLPNDSLTIVDATISRPLAGMIGLPSVYSSGNVGIGTTTPVGGLSVMNGNEGIGTWAPVAMLELYSGSSSTGMGGGSIAFDYYNGGGYRHWIRTKHNSANDTGNGIEFFVNNSAGPTTSSAPGTGNAFVMGLYGTSNVGIGSTVPGQKLDIAGTVRMTGFNLSTASSSGYILTSDANGTGTWQANTGASGTNYWNYSSAGNIGVSTTQAVGIGTTFVGGTGEAALAVMNGNVGIGTWAPAAALQVNGVVAAGSNGSFAFPYSGSYSVGLYSPASYTLQFSMSSNVPSIGGTQAGAYTGFQFYLANSPYMSFGLSSQDVSLSRGGAGKLYIGNGTGGDYSGTIVANNIGLGTTTPQGSLVVTNGNVGIGTWVPFTTEDVVGTIRSTNRQNPSSGKGLELFYDTSQDFSGLISFDRTNSVYKPMTSNALDHRYYFAGTEKIRFDSNGNVGVGTTTPGQQLEVAKSAAGALGPVLRFRNLGGNAGDQGGIQFATGGATDGSEGRASIVFNIKTGGAGQIIFNSGTSNYGAESMRIVGGNIGIGSSVPGQALDVNGTVRMTGFNMSTAPSSGYILTSDANGTGTWQANTGASGTNYWNYSSAGNIGVSTTQAVGIGTTFVGGTGEAALAVMNGNVGIGTWVPAFPLDISTSASGARVATSSSSAPALILDVPNAVGPEWFKFTTAQGTYNYGDLSAQPYAMRYGSQFNLEFDPGIIGGSDPNTYGVTFGYNDYTSNGHLSQKAGILTGGTTQVGLSVVGQSGQIADLERWGSYVSNVATVGLIYNTFSEINSNGNLGIGTITAVNQLSVNGGVGIGTAFSSFVTSTAPSGGMVVQGNVGIGSLTPSQMLDVTGTVRATAFIGDGSQLTNTPGGSNYWANTAGVGIGTYNNVGIGTTTPQAAFVVTNGNVGIGTWLPATSLQVNGTASSTNAIMRVTDGSVKLDYYISTSEPKGQLGTTTNNDFSLFSNNNIHQRIFAGGGISLGNSLNTDPGNGNIALMDNVGIGTTIPAGALTVMNGNVGIGTWVPGNNLDINGAMQVSSTGGAKTTLTPWTFDLTGLGFHTISYNGTDNGLVLYDSGKLYFKTGGTPTTRVVIDSNGNIGIGTTNPQGGLVVTNGNVGIGTWVPIGKLDVEGGGSICLNNSCQSSWPAGASQWITNGSVGIGTYSNVGIGTTTPNGGLVVMNGNVGFGITTPSANLEVDNSTTLTYSPNTGITPSVKIRTINSSSLNNQYSALMLAATADNGNNHGVVNLIAVEPTSGNTAGDFAVQLRKSDNSFAEQLRVTSVGNVGIGTNIPAGALTVMNGNVGIGTWAPGGALSVMNGNVGIGINNPTYPLHVSSAVGTVNGSAAFDTDATMTPTNSVTLYGSRFNVTQGGGGTAGGGIVGQSVSITTNGANKPTTMVAISSATNNTSSGTVPSQIEFQTGPAVTGSGAVTTLKDLDLRDVYTNSGAGTVNSQYALYVNSLSGATTNYGLYFGNNPNGGSIVSAASTNISIVPGAGGNVGIGSLTPGQALDVTGTVRATAFIGDGSQLTNTPGGSNYWTNTAGVGIGTYNNVGIGTTTPQGGLVVTNGNVGIGTWIPSSVLTINGALTFPNALSINPLGAPTSNGIGFSGSNLYIQSANTGGYQVTAADNIILESETGTTTQVVLAGQNSYLAWTNATTYSTPSTSVGTKDTYLSRNSVGVLQVGTNSTNAAGTIVANNIGIGTFSTSNAALVVTSGNVGIGTTTPQGALIVTNGNVGIGTWAPGAPLDVRGSSNGAFNLHTPSFSPNALQFFDDAYSKTSMVGIFTAADDTGSLEIGSTINGKGLWMFGANHYSATNAELATLPNYVAVNQAYPLGWGSTNSITSSLDTSLSRISSGIIGAGTGSAGSFAGSFVATNVGIGTFDTSSGSLIISSGNVGIGSLTPGQKLDVFGTVRATQFLGDGSLLTGTTASVTWTDVTGTSQGMAVNNGYIADNAALVTMTLPASAAIGNFLEVTGGVSGAGGWKIAQNAGQTIHYGSVNTTTGTGGYLSSSNQYDSVYLLCIKANTDFVVMSSQGNINYN